MTHLGSWFTEMKRWFLVPNISNISLFIFLYLQLTWSPKSITITWGRRGSLIQPVTNPRFPLQLPSLLWKASQRTLVLLSPRAALKPLRSLPQTQGQHTRKYLWHFKSDADSGLRTSSFRFPPLFCSNSCLLTVLMGLLSCFPWSQIELFFLFNPAAQSSYSSG